MRAKKGATKLARVSHLGPSAGLKCYEAIFEDGSFQQLSATGVKRRPSSAGGLVRCCILPCCRISMCMRSIPPAFGRGGCPPAF
eukprot:1116760-Pelagomonas_calceolata.AAC.1